jgi:hypothetical protein
MAKQNNKDKLTYKQMLAYMDFMNSKLNQGLSDLNQVTSGLGYYLKTYVEFMGNDEKFQEFLEDKQKQLDKELKDNEEELGLEAEVKSKKVKKM